MSAPTLSPRRRRLRLTVAGLVLLAVVGTGLGVFIHRRVRPAPYRPDEAASDITRSLARNLPADAPRPALVDVTRAAGLGGFTNFVGTRTSQMPEDVGCGAAWGDFDNDGDDDLFLVSAGGALPLPAEQLAPCRLYENRGDGTFRPVTEFPETRIHGMGAAWGDYDGDGYLDLAVSGYQALLLFHNEGGSGRFTRVPTFPNRPGFWSGVAWGDYDGDHAPDLYVCNYVQYVPSEADASRASSQLGEFVPFTLNPASYPGGTNLLLHNTGQGTFADVTLALGVGNPEGRSLSALWHDFDADGWPDLYVANDISDNVFYHNVGGKFQDISHPALVADYRSAMGLAVGDYNRDGDDDLFITHWVAQENALYDNLWSDLKGQTLRFLDVADLRGVGQMALPYVGWGTEFADVDGDGWLDLIVANGNTLEVPDSRPRVLKRQEPFLLWNQRGDQFHNIAPLNPLLAEPHNGRGLAVADFDLDGDQDVLIVNLGEGVQLLRNDMQKGHWLKLRLRSRLADGRPLGFAEGARVVARVNGTILTRSVSSASYLSQSSRTLHFGLGPATRVDRIEVHWIGGGTNVVDSVEADGMYDVVEGQPGLRRVNNSPGRSASASAVSAGSSGGPAPATAPMDERQRVVAFWAKHRAGMDAMKVDRDDRRAIGLFREALALNPAHEDARYYLGLCLANQQQMESALTELAELQRINPQSHRAWQQWGVLRASIARKDDDLAAAERALEKAQALNPEETGALLLLGEVSVMRGQRERAAERLAAVCRTNPKAVGGYFLRAYLAWKQGDTRASERFLQEARAALGPDWKPSGTTAEGDVQRRQHAESSPLSGFWERWNGVADPAASFAPLEAWLSARREAR